MLDFHCQRLAHGTERALEGGEQLLGLGGIAPAPRQPFDDGLLACGEQRRMRRG
jgi:hypothetical protein